MEQEGSSVKLWSTLKQKFIYNSGFLYIFFLIFVFLFYGIFLTSNFWMPNFSTNIQASPLNEVSTVEKRDISLIRWVYSESQNLMEVELEIKNKAFDGNNEYEYEAKSERGGNLELETILQKDDIAILQIKNIPKKFTAISFRMFIPTEGGVENTVKFYTTRAQVERSKQIRKMTYKEYRIQRLEKMIEFNNKEIEKIKDDILKENQYQENCTVSITKWTNDLSIQTEDEVKETQELIDDALLQIKGSKDKIVILNKNIDDLTEKSKKIQDLINTIE